MQEDILLDNLTPMESLLFVGKMKLNNTISDEALISKIKRLIQKFGLNECSNRLIGNLSGGGISTGERKRVSIGN